MFLVREEFSKFRHALLLPDQLRRIRPSTTLDGSGRGQCTLLDTQQGIYGWRLKASSLQGAIIWQQLAAPFTSSAIWVRTS